NPFLKVATREMWYHNHWSKIYFFLFYLPFNNYNFLFAKPSRTPFTSYNIVPSFFQEPKSISKNSLCATANTTASYLSLGNLLVVSRPYSCFTSAGFANGSKMVTLVPYSFRLSTTSTTLVFRTSGQFSLKVIPSTRIF